MKQKKNKTHQTVTWPTAMLFTIKELHRLNPKFVEITLRVRLSNAITEHKVAEVGSIPGEKGRPQKVFSMTPITKETLDKVRAEHMNLVDKADELVQLFSVSTPSPSVKTSAAPVTAAMT